MSNDNQLGIGLAKTINPKHNTLEFYINSGTAIYVDKSGKKYKGSFGIRDNSYKLLTYLAQHPGQSFTPDELDMLLNKQRQGAYSTPDRRIRDTIQTIRRTLGFTQNKTSDFFNVDKGYGIKCSVIIKPSSPVKFHQ